MAQLEKFQPIDDYTTNFLSYLSFSSMTVHHMEYVSATDEPSRRQIAGVELPAERDGVETKTAHGGSKNGRKRKKSGGAGEQRWIRDGSRPHTVYSQSHLNT